MKLYLKLEPVKSYESTVDGKVHYEQVVVRAKSEHDKGLGYPAFMCHIDTFYDVDGYSALYRKIYSGESVEAVCEIEVIE